MNILITGATGILGSSLFEYLKLNGDYVARFNREDFSWISHESNVEMLSPYDCIIHAAANTDVDGCEADPSNCYRDNSLLTERLAYAAGRANCKFIFISSTGIYGSQKTIEPYTEYDNVYPTTHHHKAKWLGELAVNRYVSNSLVLRTGWLFGGSPENPKNFVIRRIEEALTSSTRQLYSNADQFGVPTFVRDFSVMLCELLRRDEVGTFNIINQGRASRFDYVSKIIEECELNVEVIPKAASSFTRLARVSNNEMAISLKLPQLGYKPLPSWQDGLRQYIRNDLAIWLQNRLNNIQN